MVDNLKEVWLAGSGTAGVHRQMMLHLLCLHVHLLSRDADHRWLNSCGHVGWTHLSETFCSMNGDLSSGADALAASVTSMATRPSGMVVQHML